MADNHTNDGLRVTTGIGRIGVMGALETDRTGPTRIIRVEMGLPGN